MKTKINIFRYSYFVYLMILGLNITIASCSENNNQQAKSEEQKITSSSSSENVHNTLSEQEKNDGWVLLFDGTSTDHWRGYTKSDFPDQGWQVKDGLLMVEATGGEEEGYGGDIITKDQYENFEFKLDFKLSPEGNSGIIYLVKEVEGVPAWHNAPEYQLLDNEHYEKTAEIPMDKHRTGDNYDLHASTTNAMKPVGEWNEAMIRVNNRKVEHWLNGQKVVEYELDSDDWKKRVSGSKFAEYEGYGKAQKGHIGIQDHGHQLWYKNIKVRPL